MFAVIMAAVALRAAALPPSLQLAAVERTVAFHVTLLPQSAQLLRADVVYDAANEPVARLQYSVEGNPVAVEERVPEAGDAALWTQPNRQVFNLEGYPAIYQESQTPLRRFSALAWYRQDLTITLTAREGASAPLLIDVALELR